MAFDPASQWLRLSDGGYVWGRNLEPLGNTSATTNVSFPDFVHGTWSSMETCRGARSNAEVTISENTIRYSESIGTLTGMPNPGQKYEAYEVAFVTFEGSWKDSLYITISDNGRSIIIDSGESSGQASFAYHKPEAGCDGVFLLD